MENQNPLNLVERFNRWLKESITIKLMSIGFLVLILLIPTSWITGLMQERQLRAGEVMDEVAQKWSRDQTIGGPVLVIPFKREEKVDKGKDGVEIYEVTDHAFFLPELLSLKGEVKPEILHRGIFDAVVYESSLEVNANFAAPDFGKLAVPESKVMWADARLVFGISDLRGISDNPALKVGGKEMKAEPSSNLGIEFSQPGPALFAGAYQQRTKSSTGIMVPLHWTGMSDFRPDVTLSMPLKGSSQLNVVPLGKTTDVHLMGPWSNPSFDGAFLPVNREVNEQGFKADWKILHFNRPFSQEWKSSNETLSGYEFGVKLLIPVDQYQKSIRTAKYGELIVLLTFISLFMVEVMKKVRIHPFQYILIGAALIIYYTLLLSFSEHVGYNMAYLIATVSTVILVSMYSTTFLPVKKTVGLFTALLSFFYAFIFVIIQEQDYSLLLGSIGLFIIIALLMYFSRNVKWYGE